MRRIGAGEFGAVRYRTTTLFERVFGLESLAALFVFVVVYYNFSGIVAAVVLGEWPARSNVDEVSERKPSRDFVVGAQPSAGYRRIAKSPSRVRCADQ